MGDLAAKGINGAGTVIRTDKGAVQPDPASKDVRTDTRNTGGQAARDVMDTAKPGTTVPPDFQKQLAALERELAISNQRVDNLSRAKTESDKADAQSKLDVAKADREKGWFKKGLMDVLMLFLRMCFPIISIISLAVRLVRIAYKKFVKKEDIDWKREGMLLLGDLAGAAPAIGMLAGPVGFLGSTAGMLGATTGGLISAGIHGAVKITSEDKDDYLGWEKQEASGLRVGWEKAKEFGSESYAAITGKEKPSETREVERSGIDTRAVVPGDVPVS